MAHVQAGSRETDALTIVFNVMSSPNTKTLCPGRNTFFPEHRMAASSGYLSVYMVVSQNKGTPI